VATIQQTSLANSGYVPNMKVENNQDRKFNILGYQLELSVEIWRFEFFLFFSKFGEFVPFFS
jgi:hypothetical protein